MDVESQLFNNFYKQNEKYFNLFSAHVPIKGVIKAVWDIKGKENKNDIEDYKKLLSKISLLQQNAEQNVQTSKTDLKNKTNQLNEVLNKLETSKQEKIILAERNLILEQEKDSLIHQLNQLLESSKKERDNRGNILKSVNSAQIESRKQNKLISVMEKSLLLYKTQATQQQFENEELKEVIKNNRDNIKTLNQKIILLQQSNIQQEADYNNRVSQLRTSLTSLRDNEVKKQQNKIKQLVKEKQEMQFKFEETRNSLLKDKDSLINQLEIYIYKNEELTNFSKSYKKLNRKLSNEVYRLNNVNA